MSSKLDKFFHPAQIAVIGASRKKGSLGRTLIEKLLRYGYEGAIYPVNPKAEAILGLPVVPEIEKLPSGIDLAVVQVSKHLVLESLARLGKKGISRVIIITAGFKEVGGEGIEREKEVVAVARKYGMDIIGPNCMGIINTSSHLNCSFSPTDPYTGNVAFISQSGALGVAILEMAREMHLGFSVFASTGNKAVLKDVDFLEYCEHNEETKAIVLYMESIEETEKFALAAKRISKHKPIIAIKAGRTASGAKAASSHTGALASSDKVSDAFLKYCGIIRADTVQEMFDLSQAFASQPLMRGDRVAVLTNARGPAIMATDAIESNKLKLADFSVETRERLKTVLPEEASIKNPVDMIASADHNLYEKSAEIILADENVDALLTIIVRPPNESTPNSIAEHLSRVREKFPDKPFLAVVMAQTGRDVDLGLFREYGLPVYKYPQSAARTLRKMKQYYDMHLVPETKEPDFSIDRDGIAAIFNRAEKENRNFLYQSEVFDIFSSMDLPVPRYVFAADVEKAVDFWREKKIPVVMKIESCEIQHKSDIGGVKVNLNSEEDIRSAWDKIMASGRKYTKNIRGAFLQDMEKIGTEMALGLFNDPNYGKMVMLGLGGIMVELLKDVVFHPLNVSLPEAEKMIEQLKFKRLLEGFRGKIPVHKPWLAEVIVKLSMLGKEFPQIAEMDINPLSVQHDDKDSVILDGRIRIDD
jgi:acetyltransferase